MRSVTYLPYAVSEYRILRINAITRLPIDQLNETWVVACHHLPDMSAIVTAVA